MQKYIGSDVTSVVTLPVLIFEPMSMLQKMAEVCVSIFKLHCCVWFFSLSGILSISLSVTVDGVLLLARSG